MAALFKLTIQQVEDFKLEESIHWTPVDWQRHKNVSGIAAFNMRQLLQRFGTEVGREIFGKNFWVEQCLPPSEDNYSKLVVVTDVRFENEVNHIIHTLGGHVWLINRKSDTVDEHASEQIPTFTPSYTVNNTSTIDDLRLTVATGLQELGFDIRSASPTNERDQFIEDMKTKAHPFVHVGSAAHEILRSAAALVNIIEGGVDCREAALNLATAAYSVWTLPPTEGTRHDD